MQAIWQRNGWDGAARVVRIKFRYKRECLRELGIECPYELLDQFAGLWAYSTLHWLRHTVPSDDTNRGRWMCSPFWLAVQEASFDGEPIPLEGQCKYQGELKLLCQMLAGCAMSAAAFLVDKVPELDDGCTFLRWFYAWMGDYLEDKGLSFADMRQSKRQRLGLPAQTAA